MTAPVSVVVLTFNEARNLQACLESLAGWPAAIFVVDSGSTDGTRAIAERFGATVVEHPFETHAQQWTWALQTLPLHTPWVLGLDADQRLTPELQTSLVDALSRTESEGVNGYYMARRQVFRGVWIRHGGYYPKFLLKLFRRSAVRLDASELVDHHFHIEGVVKTLSGDLIEDNQNEQQIAVWTEKHNRYAVLQARQELAQMAAGEPVGFGAVFQNPDARTRWMKQTWRRLPLFIRPCAYVFYRYVIRLGFLDGKQGFIFHVLQAFWYRLLVDINIDEMKAKGAAKTVAVGVDHPTR